jgi:hypothetical protein
MSAKVRVFRAIGRVRNAKLRASAVGRVKAGAGHIGRLGLKVSLPTVAAAAGAVGGIGIVRAIEGRLSPRKDQSMNRVGVEKIEDPNLMPEVGALLALVPEHERQGQALLAHRYAIEVGRLLEKNGTRPDEEVELAKWAGDSLLRKASMAGVMSVLGRAQGAVKAGVARYRVGANRAGATGALAMGDFQGRRTPTNPRKIMGAMKLGRRLGVGAFHGGVAAGAGAAGYGAYRATRSNKADATTDLNKETTMNDLETQLEKIAQAMAELPEADRQREMIRLAQSANIGAQLSKLAGDADAQGQLLDAWAADDPMKKMLGGMLRSVNPLIGTHKSQAGAKLKPATEGVIPAAAGKGVGSQNAGLHASNGGRIRAKKVAVKGSIRENANAAAKAAIRIGGSVYNQRTGGMGRAHKADTAVDLRKAAQDRWANR